VLEPTTSVLESLLEPRQARRFPRKPPSGLEAPVVRPARRLAASKVKDTYAVHHASLRGPLARRSPLKHCIRIALVIASGITQNSTISRNLLPWCPESWFRGSVAHWPGSAQDEPAGNSAEGPAAAAKDGPADEPEAGPEPIFGINTEGKDDPGRFSETANAPIFGVNVQSCSTEWNWKLRELSPFTKAFADQESAN
jgi:hypothetical protein